MNFSTFENNALFSQKVSLKCLSDKIYNFKKEMDKATF